MQKRYNSYIGAKGGSLRSITNSVKRSLHDVNDNIAIGSGLDSNVPVYEPTKSHSIKAPRSLIKPTPKTLQPETQIVAVGESTKGLVSLGGALNPLNNINFNSLKKKAKEPLRARLVL